MSLTDDWNAGKLDSGWYFVKIDNQVYPDYYNDYFVQSGDVDGLQVLAPCDYDHISELEKKAKKYDSIKVNGNYPDKISRLKSRIKHLLDLQANQDKEVERLRDENEELKYFDGKNVCLENEKLRLDNNQLRQFLKECKDYIDFCSVPEGFGKSYIAENLLTKINEVLK